MQPNRFAFALAFSILTLGTTLDAQRGFFIKEGIEVFLKPPATWTHLGSTGDRGSLRAMFCAPRAFTPKAGRRGEHTPTLRVMWLDDAVIKEAAARKSEWPLRTPYKNARDYIDRAHGKGAKINNVADITLDGHKGLSQEVQYPREHGDLTIHLASIKLDGGELLIEFELITEQYKKQRGSFVKSLSTVALTPKDKIKPLPAVETPPWEKDLEGWLRKPKADRATYRREWGEKWMAFKSAAYQPGWKIVKSKYFLILTRTDAKYTKRITQAAETSFKWAEDKFGRISDDVVMPAILRIFDSEREEAVFRSRELAINPNEYNPTHREIYAFKDANMGNLGDGMGAVIRGVARYYIHDKHPLILDNMPRWVDAGLYGMSDGTRILSGKKIVFFPSDLEQKRFAHYAQVGEKQLVWWYTHEDKFGAPKDGEEEVDFAAFWPECTRLMRWIEEGGDKVLKKPDFLSVYLAEVGKTAIGFRPRPELDIDMDLVDEKRIKDLRKLIYTRRKDFLVKANYAVMPFGDDAWPPINEKWQTWYEEYATRKFKKK